MMRPRSRQCRETNCCRAAAGRDAAQRSSRKPPGSSSQRCTAETFHLTVRRVSDTCFGEQPSPINRYSDDRGRPVAAITDARRRYPSLIRAIPSDGPACLPIDRLVLTETQGRTGRNIAYSAPSPIGHISNLFKQPSVEPRRIIEAFKALCDEAAWWASL